MKKILLLSLIFIIPLSCSTEKEEKRLSYKQIEKEKEAIIQTMRNYNTAYENKNFAALTETLADEVLFFGTDSSEVIRTFADFKKKMLQQWELFDELNYGKMKDVSIKMDDKGTWASIIFGIPLEVTIDKKSTKLFLRVQRTMKKEQGKWVISSGVVGLVNYKQGIALDKLLRERGSEEDTEKEES